MAVAVFAVVAATTATAAAATASGASLQTGKQAVARPWRWCYVTKTV